MADRLSVIHQWLQREDEALLYAPDAAHGPLPVRIMVPLDVRMTIYVPPGLRHLQHPVIQAGESVGLCTITYPATHCGCGYAIVWEPEPPAHDRGDW